MKVRSSIGLHIHPFDLDGDGVPDAVVEEGARVFFMKYRIYVTRGGCGHFVGEIETAGALTKSKQDTHGLAKLEASWGCGDHPGAGPQHARWSFDGKKYGRTERWTDGGAKRCNDPESF